MLQLLHLSHLRSLENFSSYDEKGKQIYSDTINIVPEKIKYNLNIESNRYSKCDRFSLDVKVHSNNDDLSIYSCTYHDGSLKINNESNDNVLLTGIILKKPLIWWKRINGSS